MDIFLLPVLLGLVVVIPVVRPMAVPQSLMSAELNLTPTQQQRLQEIHTRAQDNALALLTPDQQAQWTPDSLWQNTSHLDLTPLN
ncbi:MAG: hypothetical protein NZ482_09900, partial [Gloeomargarita sp. SKYG98]|nr:hypothetical protein [Gloeomargarita sp. SKYG98]